MNDQNYAEWWKRLICFVIDIAMLMLLLVFIIFCYDKFNNSGGFDEFFRFWKFMDLIEFIFIGVYFLYYTLLESIFGLTIGKIITRTRVVDYQGNKPSFGKVLIRSLIRFIPIDWFTYFSKNPLGWHDSVSKTKVINKDSASL